MTAAQRLALPAAWLALIALFGVIEPDTFLTSANAQNILGSQAVLIIVTMGLLIPLTAGDYDLSIASVLTLSSMIVALLNAQQGWPVGLAVVVAVAAGALAGLANGALVVLLRADSLVITLGSGTLIAGIVLWISNSETIGGVSSALVDPVSSWKLLGLPLAFVYGLAAVRVGLVPARLHAERPSTAVRRSQPPRRPARGSPRRSRPSGRVRRLGDDRRRRWRRLHRYDGRRRPVVG